MESPPASGMSCGDLLKRTGIWVMLAGAFSFSANTAFAKLMTAKYSSFQVLYFRGLAVALCASVILLMNIQLPLPHTAGTRKPVGWAIGRGVLGTAALSCLYYAFTYLPLSEAVVLYGINPIFTTLFSACTGEPVSWIRWLASLVFVAGATLVLNPFTSDAFTSIGDSSVWIGRFVAVVGSVFCGGALVCARQLSKGGSCHWVSQAWWQGALTVLLAALASFIVQFKTVETPSSMGILILMALAAVVGQCCAGFAVTREHASIVGVLWNLDLVCSLGWQVLLFGSPVKWYQGIGVACAFIASCMCVLEKSVTAPPAEEQQQEERDADPSAAANGSASTPNEPVAVELREDAVIVITAENTPNATSPPQDGSHNPLLLSPTGIFSAPSLSDAQTG